MWHDIIMSGILFKTGIFPNPHIVSCPSILITIVLQTGIIKFPTTVWLFLLRAVCLTTNNLLPETHIKVTFQNENFSLFCGANIH